jgi:biotin operon repressor
LSSVPLIPEDIAAFIRRSVTSIWTLELLLFFRKSDRAAWSVDEVVHELRGSRLLVLDVIESLRQAGLIVEEPEGAFRYQPAKPELADLVLRLEQLSIEKPMAVRSAVLTAPHDKIQVFADAFRVKKE